jgi:hypothetical protein
MIDQKLAIITIHDVNPSHSEKILKTSDELYKLKSNTINAIFQNIAKNIM